MKNSFRDIYTIRFRTEEERRCEEETIREDSRKS